MKNWYKNLTKAQKIFLFAVSTILVLFDGVGFIPLSVLIYLKLGEQPSNENLERWTANYQIVVNEIDSEFSQGKPYSQPSWLKIDEEERRFTNEVIGLVCRTSVPIAFAVRGFMSPDSSSILFALAAKMEIRGASFAGQQAAAARYIEEHWNGLLPDDQETFRRETMLENVLYRSNIGQSDGY